LKCPMRGGRCTSTLRLAVHDRRPCRRYCELEPRASEGRERMSTPESGSPNLLDEFFSASPTTGLAGDAADGAVTAPVEQAGTDQSEDLEEPVEVDEVEPVAEEEQGLPPIPVRRSLPPPAPSKRGVKRVASAPPPRGRSSARASAS